MTVVIITSGSSYTIPPDWTSVNQVETGGAGGGGGNGFTGCGGGSGGYSTTSNIAGLSGSITISIGTAGTGGAAATSTRHDGTAGTATWFNGATLSASTVGANGGGAGNNDTTGGVGASTTGAKGTATAGSNGGISSGGTITAGGGAGAPGPDGLGGTGASSVTLAGGAGGNGDNSVGGAGGAGGTATTPTGGNGTASTPGGGGGGGGFGSTTVSGAAGGTGGLPGAGGGGGGADSTNNALGAGGNGGGGQIRITYTPVAAPSRGFYDLPPMFQYRSLRAQRDDRTDFTGWQQSPRPATVLPQLFKPATDVPPGRYGWHSYQDWKWTQRDAYAPQTALTCSFDLPVRTWVNRGNLEDYKGWSAWQVPKEIQPPHPWTEVPRGVYNAASYQDWKIAPIVGNVNPPPIQPWTDMPIRRDPRWDFNGWQAFQQPISLGAPLPVTDVPKGTWSVSSYQFWTTGFQRLEIQPPLPWTDVPKGINRFDYSGTQAFQAPATVHPAIQSSQSYALPPLASPALLHNWLFVGTTVAPIPGNFTPPVMRSFLPLVGVGSYGP